MKNSSNHTPLLTSRIDTTFKTNLKDVTFVVPLRVDSTERRENIDTLINYTYTHFETNFIVLEADSERRYYLGTEPKGLKYEYLDDKNVVFHRTKWINKLISVSVTPIVAVWDADAIAPPEQITEAVKKIRSNKAVLGFPYDGRFYSCDRISSNMFKRLLSIEILFRRIPVMNLMYGHHSVGGAFIVNKNKYISVGGENENFYGWGPEDMERVKRLEIYGMPIHYSPGTLFHLWHPMGKNSWFANSESERMNRNELQSTCKSFSVIKKRFLK